MITLQHQVKQTFKTLFRDTLRAYLIFALIAVFMVIALKFPSVLEALSKDPDVSLVLNSLSFMILTVIFGGLQLIIAFTNVAAYARELIELGVSRKALMITNVVINLIMALLGTLVFMAAFVFIFNNYPDESMYFLDATPSLGIAVNIFLGLFSVYMMAAFLATLFLRIHWGFALAITLVLVVILPSSIQVGASDFSIGVYLGTLSGAPIIVSLILYLAGYLLVTRDLPVRR